MMRQLLGVRWALTATFLFSTASLACAQTSSTNPVADAFVFSGEPIFDYGGAGVLAVAAPGLPEGEFQSLLRFDLAGAKSNFDTAFGAGNWMLSSATLQLSSGSANNPLFNAPAAGQFRVSWLENDNWIEGSGAPTTPGNTGINWNSLPALLSANDQDIGTFGFDGTINTTNSYSLTLASGLQGDAASGGLASFRLRAAPGDATMSAAFNSRSFSTAARRPVLTLNAVAIPEPAGGVLALVGIAAVALVHRRRRRR